MSKRSQLPQESSEITETQRYGHTHPADTYVSSPKNRQRLLKQVMRETGDENEAVSSPKNRQRLLKLELPTLFRTTVWMSAPPRIVRDY